MGLFLFMLLGYILLLIEIDIILDVFLKCIILKIMVDG